MTIEQDQSDIVFEMADGLFGAFVDNVDRGKVIDLHIEWVPVESDGDTVEYPDVYIDGESARDVFKRTASWTDTGSKLGEEALDEGADHFNDMMAGFNEAVEYQRDLRDLDAEIGMIAISADSGYFRYVKDDLESGGLSLGDGETISIARHLIIQDVHVLGDAYENPEGYNGCYSANSATITEAFEREPNSYWVMVGCETGIVRAMGGRGFIPNSDSHIDMEIGFGEELFTYLRPN